MSETEFLDSVLLPLADAFESNRLRIVPIEPASVEEFEPLRTFLATKCAEGLFVNFKGAGYCLTPKGYLDLGPRIVALRTFGK